MTDQPTSTQEVIPTKSQRIGIFITRFCNGLFYGIGLYGLALELATCLSLVPAEYEETVNLQTPIFTYASALGGYIVFMFWITFFFLRLAMVALLARAKAATGDTTPSPAPAMDKHACLRMHVLGLFCFALIANDTVMNRAQDSQLVQGGLARMGVVLAEAVDVYVKELCVFAVIFGIAFITAMKKAFAEVRRVRAAEGDVESNAAAPPAVVAKPVIVDEKEKLVDVDDTVTLVDVDEEKEIISERSSKITNAIM